MRRRERNIRGRHKDNQVAPPNRYRKATKGMPTLSAVLTAVLLASISFAFPNEPDGYNGIRWGTDISNLKGMVMIYPSGGKGSQRYIRPSDPLRFGNARLKSVEYWFKEGNLSCVVIRVSDLLNYVALKKECYTIYGEGNRSPGPAEQYTWEGETTQITLTSKFDIS